MGFRELDKIRDLDREVGEIQTQLARLPISLPTAGGNGIGAGRITTAVTAASYDPATKKKTLGKGKMKLYSVDTGDVDVLGTVDVDVYTRVEEITPVDKDVQYLTINGRREITMEPCKVGTV